MRRSKITRAGNRYRYRRARASSARERGAELLRRFNGALQVAALIGDSAYTLQTIGEALTDAHGQFGEWRCLISGRPY